MQTHQRIVFGNMGEQNQPQQETTPEEQEYLHNTMVFELAANWPYIMNLMEKFRANEIKEVDPLERDWLNFILGNHIEVEKYEYSDQFINAWFKNKE